VGKVRRYHGTKEDVYLADFHADPSFAKELCDLGVRPDNVLVLMRPPAHDALYHRFQNKFFDEALALLLERDDVQVVLLPRNNEQRATYSARSSLGAAGRLIVPPKPLDGANLIAASDLVISAGGTINREAAALGVPVASVYAGSWAAVDEELVNEGRLQRIASSEDLGKLAVQKKFSSKPRRAIAVIEEVVRLILE
jgi:predicted glycosyltransferase